LTGRIENRLEVLSFAINYYYRSIETFPDSFPAVQLARGVKSEQDRRLEAISWRISAHHPRKLGRLAPAIAVRRRTSVVAPHPSPAARERGRGWGVEKSLRATSVVAPHPSPAARERGRGV